MAMLAAVVVVTASLPVVAPLPAAQAIAPSAATPIVAACGTGFGPPNPGAAATPPFAIRATMAAYVACFNAPDPQELVSFYTDAFRQRPGRTAVSLPITARSGQPSVRAALIDVRDVRSLDDTRVSALVIYRLGETDREHRDRTIFAWEDGRWRIDDVVSDPGTALCGDPHSAG